MTVGRPRPAVRVGPAFALPPRPGETLPRKVAGVAEIALTEAGLDASNFPLDPLRLAEQTNESGRLLLESDSSCVGWRIRASEGVASGETLEPIEESVDWLLDDTQAYVPVLRGDCSGSGEVVGFLNLRSGNLQAGFDPQDILPSEERRALNASARHARSGPPPIDTSWTCDRPAVLCVPSYLEPAS